MNYYFTLKKVSRITLPGHNHPVHRSKAVKEFVELSEGKLRLFHFPPYSPDLNPDELVWRHVKHHKVGKESFTSKEELFKKNFSALKELQRMPYKSISYLSKLVVDMLLVDVG